MVAADVNAAVGILYHARRLQQDLIEWSRRAERQAIDIVSGDGKLAAADVRRQGIARRLELGDHVNRVQIGRAFGVGIGGKRRTDGGGQQGGGDGSRQKTRSHGSFARRVRGGGVVIL